MRYLNNFPFSIHCSLSGICCLSFALHAFHSLDSHSCRAFGSLRPLSLHPSLIPRLKISSSILAPVSSLVLAPSRLNSTRLDWTRLISSHRFSSHLSSSSTAVAVSAYIRFPTKSHSQLYNRSSSSSSSSWTESSMYTVYTAWERRSAEIYAWHRNTIFDWLSAILFFLSRLHLVCVFMCFSRSPSCSFTMFFFLASLPLMLFVCYFVFLCPFASLQIELQRGW